MIDLIKRIWLVFQNGMQKKQVRQGLNVITVLVSLIFIGYAIQSHWTDLNRQEFTLNPVNIILAVVLYPIGTLPMIASWHWLLRALGVHKSFRVNMRIYAQSMLPKHIPGLVWYVTSRTLLYQEQGVSAGVVIGATAAETFLMALSGFCLSVWFFTNQVTALDQFTMLRIIFPVSIIGVIILAVWAPGGTRWIGKIFKHWQKEGENGMQIDRQALWISLIWIFLAWIGGGIMLWTLVRAITPLDWRMLPTIIGTWGAAGAVSLTLGIGIQGLGLREVTLGAMLSFLISPLMAIVVAIIFRLTLLMGDLLWVFFVVNLSRDKFVKIKK